MERREFLSSIILLHHVLFIGMVRILGLMFNAVNKGLLESCKQDPSTRQREGACSFDEEIANEKIIIVPSEAFNIIVTHLFEVRKHHYYEKPHKCGNTGSRKLHISLVEVEVENLSKCCKQNTKKMKVKSCLTISLKILKVAGAAPYLYRRSVTHRNVKIFSATVHTLLVAVGVPVVGYFNNYLHYEVESTSYGAYMVCCWIHMITFTFSMLPTVFNARSFDEVLTQIYQLEKSINTEHKERQKVEAAIIAFIIVGNIIIAALSSYVDSVMGITLTTILGNLCFFISESCSLIMMTNFIAMMYVLRLFFSTLNSEIEEYQQNIRLQLQRNSRVNNDAFAAYISKVMDQHMKLCQVSEMVNSAHGQQIVLWVLTSSYTVTSCIYIAFLESVDRSTLEVGGLSCLGIWGVYHVARICITVHSTHTTALRRHRWKAHIYTQCDENIVRLSRGLHLMASGALDARVSFALIAPALLGLKHGNNLYVCRRERRLVQDESGEWIRDGPPNVDTPKIPGKVADQ
ncbi:hypothetical protein PR048_019805 [Dryococelus australis]|uniref:Gustatory receptor n=1 Tax=Dryococelus australis TaxID=614101 RepID=A0ABQ9H4G5_9NEOP|nr:hypothetical protein PR048_019805 [Dryococelus australis]